MDFNTGLSLRAAEIGLVVVGPIVANAISESLGLYGKLLAFGVWMTCLVYVATYDPLIVGLWARYGTKRPMLIVVLSGVVGFVIFASGAWLLKQKYEVQQTATFIPALQQDAIQTTGKEKSLDQPASRDVPQQPKEGSSSSAAEKAADHYRRTSLSLKKEEVRQGYRVFCAQIADRFNLTKWSDVNQLAQMIDVNMGDIEAYERAEKEIPGTAWVAIRILVAFETPKERPMYMSYVFIGRAPDGDEVVALYNDVHQWTELSRSSSSVAGNNEGLMFDTAKQELARLTEKIAEDIQRLR